MISSSITSLLGLLRPPSSIATQLSAFPVSVLSGLEGPNAISAVDQLYADKGANWFTALPSDAESWVLGLPSQAVTILPQVISLQSLANNAVYTSSPTPTPTLVPPTNDFFSTATPTLATTVAATAQSNANLGLSKGQVTGIVVGIAALFTVCCTIGFMLYDHRKRKSVARTMRAAHMANLAVNPRTVGAPPTGESELSRRWRESRQSQQDRPSAAEPGGTGSDAQMEEMQAAPHEVYEMHTPEIGR